MLVVKWKVTSETQSHSVFQARYVRQVREWQIATNQSFISISWAVQTILWFLLTTNSLCFIDENSMYLTFMPRSHWKLMPPGIDDILKLFFISSFKTWFCSCCCFKCLPLLHPHPCFSVCELILETFSYELQKAMLPEGTEWYFMWD